jgi:hypothetical protein
VGFCNRDGRAAAVAVFGRDAFDKRVSFQKFHQAAKRGGSDDFAMP